MEAIALAGVIFVGAYIWTARTRYRKLGAVVIAVALFLLLTLGPVTAEVARAGVGGKCLDGTTVGVTDGVGAGAIASRC